MVTETPAGKQDPVTEQVEIDGKIYIFIPIEAVNSQQADEVDAGGVKVRFTLFICAFDTMNQERESPILPFKSMSSSPTTTARKSPEKQMNVTKAFGSLTHQVEEITVSDDQVPTGSNETISTAAMPISVPEEQSSTVDDIANVESSESSEPIELSFDEKKAKVESLFMQRIVQQSELDSKDIERIAKAEFPEEQQSANLIKITTDRGNAYHVSATSPSLNRSLSQVRESQNLPPLTLEDGKDYIQAVVAFIESNSKFGIGVVKEEHSLKMMNMFRIQKT